MKLIVETTGEYSITDLTQKRTMPKHRPSVVANTNFVQQCIGFDKLKVVKNGLPEAANDEDFVAYWKENPDIAVDAYLSELNGETPDEKPKAKSSSSSSSEKKEAEVDSDDSSENKPIGRGRGRGRPKKQSAETKEDE